MLLDGTRSIPVRTAAAVELVRHIQMRGQMLSRSQRKDLEDLLAKSPDAGLKASVANVLGSMQRDPTQVPRRLGEYYPPPPVAGVATPAPPLADPLRRP